MKSASNLIDEVIAGKNPSLVIDRFIEDVSGPNRSDLSEPEVASKFQELIVQSANAVPYMDHAYVDTIMSQLRSDPTSIGELTDMAKRNRDEYAAEGADIGQNEQFGMWNSIHQALVASATDANPGAVS